MIALPQVPVILLWNTVVKITVVLALTAFAVCCLRRSSASVRHIVWAIGLGCTLVLPLFSIALPTWNASVPIATALPLQRSDMSGVGSPTTLAGRSLHGSSYDTDGTPKAPDNQVIASAPEPKGHTQLSSHLVVLFLWLCGAVVVACRILRGVATTLRLQKRSQPVVLGPLLSAVDTAMAAMLPKGDATVLIADPSVSLKVPVTWGALRPTVMLPASSVSWPIERVTAALLHELAHVRRQDWLTHMCSAVVCAVYWFHPLVWLAARAMREESETACDDLVLQAGMPASDYARHLLDVAIGARKNGLMAYGVVAMAQNPRVENRLRTVLATGLARRPVTVWGTAGVCAAALILTLPLAVLRLSAKPAVLAVAPAMLHFSGGDVRLVAISHGMSAGQPAWNTHGALIVYPALPVDNSTLSVEAGKQIHQFVFRPVGIPSAAHFAVETPDASTSSFTSGEFPAGQKYLKFSGSFPSEQRAANIRVGIAGKHWETLSARPAAGSGSSSTDMGANIRTIAFSPPSMIGDKVCYTVSDNVADMDTRVVCVLNSQRLVEGVAINNGRSGVIGQRTLTFSIPPGDRIKEIQFQARPYEWLEFRNVPLQPGSGTTTPSDAVSRA